MRDHAQVSAVFETRAASFSLNLYRSNPSSPAARRLRLSSSLATRSSPPRHLYSVAAVDRNDAVIVGDYDVAWLDSLSCTDDWYVDGAQAGFHRTLCQMFFAHTGNRISVSVRHHAPRRR